MDGKVMADNQILVEPIPFETAVELCALIRADAEINWHTASARWCYQCREIAGDNPENRGFLRAEGNHGCILINRKFVEMKA
jgi:hypothetical protein